MDDLTLLPNIGPVLADNSTPSVHLGASLMTEPLSLPNLLR
jgi:hypothetical protein